MFVALAAILYVIALVMIGFGGSIVADGSQMLTIDRGVAYYIGGMGMVSAGAVLLGIATLVLCLHVLNRSLKQARMPVVSEEAGAADADAVFPVVAAATPVTADLASAETDYSEDEEQQQDYAGREQGAAFEPRSADLAIDEVNAALASVRRRNYAIYLPEAAVHDPEDQPEAEPFVMTADNRVRRSAFGYHSDVRSELPPLAHEPVGHGADEVRPAPYEGSSFGLSSQPVQTTTAEEEPAAAAEAHALASEDPPPPHTPTPTVVGSYESGGNRYIMYSDGSIDAHLPGGVRTFLSLEELKQFVSSSSAKV